MSHEEEKTIKDKSSKHWNCSHCTFENSPDDFQCKMCLAKRGSSSRQSSINPLLATQQYRPLGHKKHNTAKQKDPANKTTKKQKVKMDRVSKRGRQARGPAKLSNIDRKSGRSLHITVNNVTVTFTEYELKPKKTTPVKKSKKNSSDLPHSLVASEIDSSSKSSFTSHSESLQSYTDGTSFDKTESNGIDH